MEELKRLRRARGLSQAKLAALADLDPSTVSQIETGARRANSRTLERIASALGVEVRELFPLGQAPLWSDESGRRGPKLADAADILLRFAHMLLMQWEKELPARAEADDDEWLAEVAAMWKAFGLANYAVLEELGADRLHDAQDWFARYMDVNAAIHRLNAAIRAHGDSDALPDELLLKPLDAA